MRRLAEGVNAAYRTGATLYECFGAHPAVCRLGTDHDLGVPLRHFGVVLLWDCSRSAGQAESFPLPASLTHLTVVNSAFNPCRPSGAWVIGFADLGFRSLRSLHPRLLAVAPSGLQG